MAEEFQESEVIFSDRDHFCYLRSDDNDYADDFVNFNARHGRLAPPRTKYHTRTMRDGGRLSKKDARSLPVGIPERISRRIVEEEEEMDEEEIVPPHLLAERRIAGGKMAFSVCTGNGRTLKGRDLRRVRNSILRMTGFLEA